MPGSVARRSYFRARSAGESPASNVAYSGIEKALDDLARRTSSVRARCTRWDIHGLGDPLRREMAAIDRAGAIVWLAAALEQFLSDLLVALLDELNTCAVPHSSVKLPLFALLSAP